jgi:cytochrome oxidase Cu insertion factor (SCO1/SenC/PrrC family)
MRRLPSMQRSLVVAIALALGVVVGIVVAVTSSRSPSAAPAAGPMAPDVSWPAGTRVAPPFRLPDQAGRPVSLRALRGRAVIVTFIDPVCRNLCPLEAAKLGKVVRDLGPHAPAVVSVSVNPWADKRANFRADARAWNLPSSWRWATGSREALAQVWRSYRVGVQVQTKRLAGVTVRNVVHTEASYLIDAQGFERALFLYPFRAEDVEHALRRIGT